MLSLSRRLGKESHDLVISAITDWLAANILFDPAFSNRAVAAHDEDYTGSHPFRLYPWFVLLVLDMLLIFTCFLFLKQYNKKLLRHIPRKSI